MAREIVIGWVGNVGVVVRSLCVVTTAVLLAACVPTPAYDASIPFRSGLKSFDPVGLKSTSGGDGLAVYELQSGASNVYLLASEDGLFLVDAGLPHMADWIVRRIEDVGRDPQELRLIYVTHAHVDHYGSAAALREITGAPIAVHRDDAEDLARGKTELGMVRDWQWVSSRLLPMVEPLLEVEPTPPDIVLDDGDRLDAYGLDAVILHTPGHTPGSSVLLVEDRLAFVGDLVSMTGWPHAQSSYADSWQQIAASLATVQATKPELVYAGHGSRPMSGEEFQELRVTLVEESDGIKDPLAPHNIHQHE